MTPIYNVQIFPPPYIISCKLEYDFNVVLSSKLNSIHIFWNWEISRAHPNCVCVSITTISNSSSWFQCKGDIKYSSRKQTYVDIAYTLYQKGTKKFDIEGAVNQARNMVLLPSTYSCFVPACKVPIYCTHISMIPQHGFFQFPLINVIQILIKPLELKRHIIHLVKWSLKWQKQRTCRGSQRRNFKWELRKLICCLKARYLLKKFTHQMGSEKKPHNFFSLPLPQARNLYEL